MAFPKNPPDVPVLDSAVIGRVTDEERQLVGQLAELAGMTISAFVRQAVLRYVSAVQQTAADRSAADAAVRESAEA